MSGHGFGHATRSCEIFTTLLAAEEAVRLRVLSAAPRRLFQDRLGPDLVYDEVALDVGALQSDSLTIDYLASLQGYAELARRKGEIVAREVSRLRDWRPDVVYADIPGLAFEVARGLGVRGVGVANFSWDWIYEDFLHELPASLAREHAWVVDDLRASYGQADLLLRLPMAGDLRAFPTIVDVPLVARHATHEREAVREQLDLPLEHKTALLSFGGFGVSLESMPEVPEGMTFVVSEGSSLPSGYRAVSDRDLRARGYGYEDLVAAVDVVVTKPGYGIVSECLANRSAIVFTSRGRFAEYPVLESFIRENMPHAFIDNCDLRAGRWMPAIEAALAMGWPEKAVPLGGAQVIARMLMDRPVG